VGGAGPTADAREVVVVELGDPACSSRGTSSQEPGNRGSASRQTQTTRRRASDGTSSRMARWRSNKEEEQRAAAWKRPWTAGWVDRLSWMVLTAEGVAWLAIAMFPSRVRLRGTSAPAWCPPKRDADSGASKFGGIIGHPPS
jgi:hypothetical protein